MKLTLYGIFLLLSFVLVGTASENLSDQLFEAVRKGDLAKVQSLLDQGADVDAKSRYGSTPLFVACDKGHLEIAKLLIDRGADVNVKDAFYNSSPIDWAEKHVEIIKLLLQKGASPEDVLVSGARGGNAELVKTVLEHSKPSATALSNALVSANETDQQIARMLKDAGAVLPPSAQPADPNVQTEERKESTATKIPAKEIEPPPVVKVTKPANWPSFRGTGAAGIADGQNPPLQWDGESGTNIAWKTPIPGLSHSSPVVWGNRIFLTTAISSDPESSLKHGLYGDVAPALDLSQHSWRIYSLDKNTGKIQWERVVYEGKPNVKRHPKSTQANSTPATDGKHVVALFGFGGLYCYDVQGKLLWKRDLGMLDAGWFYDPDYQWGYGSSPVIHKDLVIIQADLQKNSYIAAFKLKNGEPVWKTDRDEIPSWGTPTIVETPAGAQVIANATRFVRGYDVSSGKEVWRLSGNSEITVPTPFTAHGLIYVTSGYRPIQPIYAIRLNAKGDISLQQGSDQNEHVAWSKNRGGPYMPTPIVYGDYLYTCANNGVVTAYHAKSGERIYQQRLGGQGSGYAFTASPVAGDGRLYFTSEDGEVYVVQAGSEYQVLAVNKLNEVILATPAISDSMLIIRGIRHIYGIKTR